MIFGAAGGCQCHMSADAATANDANAVQAWGNAPLSMQGRGEQSY